MDTIPQKTPLIELYEKGIERFTSGDRAAAAKYFHQVLNIDSKYSPAWNNLGVIAFQENRHIEAESYFQNACESDPENLEAVANLADLYFTTKKYSKADTLYTFLTQKDQDNPEHFVRLGDCFIMSAEYNSAYSCYKRAAELKPESNAVQQRVQIVASALAPVPFAITRDFEHTDLRIGIGGDAGIIHTLFDNTKTEFIQVNSTFDCKKYQFNPIDIVFISDEPSIFSNTIPALCKILAFKTVPDSLNLTESERLTNIDFVLCTSDDAQKKLVDEHHFAAYQVVVLPEIRNFTGSDFQTFRHRLLEFYAEMALFYAQRLELQDSHEQEYWLLKKVVSVLPEYRDIDRRFQSARKKIDHLFKREEYKELYDESASMSMPELNVTSNIRYQWLLNRIKSTPGTAKLVDIGCHKGEFSIALAEEGYTVTGVDIAEENIKTATESLAEKHNLTGSVDFRTAFAEDLGDIFPENSFDGAILMEILEHVPDVDTVLNGVEKAVRPGGYVYITVPLTHLEMVCNQIFNAVREFPEHVRRFTPENIPAYFRGKEDLSWEEISKSSGAEEWKWLGIWYRVR